MGKIPLLALCLFAAASPGLGASPERILFDGALQSGNLQQAGKILGHWKAMRPGDAEALAATGDYFYAEAREGQPDIQDQPGEEVRVRPLRPPGVDTRRWVSWRTSPARKSLLRQAGDCWRRALKERPGRLDLYFDLARLEQDLDDFEAQYDVLLEALEYADKHPGGLKWKGDAPLPSPAAEMIPRFIQGSVFYYSERRPLDPEKVLRLSRLAQTFYPRNPYAYNSLAVFFSLRKDWPRTLKYLLLANRQAPEDSLVLLNIAETLETMGKKKEARIFYRKVLALHNDAQCMERARERLGG